MTTSFAHFVRGRFAQSALANPAGFLLAIVCAAGVPWSFGLAWLGRRRAVYSVSEVLLWIIGAITVLALVQWLVRLVF